MLFDVIWKSSILLDSSCSMMVFHGATSQGAVFTSNSNTIHCSCSATGSAGYYEDGSSYQSSMNCYLDIVECNERDIP